MKTLQMAAARQSTQYDRALLSEKRNGASPSLARAGPPIGGSTDAMRGRTKDVTATCDRLRLGPVLGARYMLKRVLCWHVYGIVACEAVTEWNSSRVRPCSVDPTRWYGPRGAAAGVARLDTGPSFRPVLQGGLVYFGRSELLRSGNGPRPVETRERAMV